MLRSKILGKVAWVFPRHFVLRTDERLLTENVHFVRSTMRLHEASEAVILSAAKNLLSSLSTCLHVDSSLRSE